jgi:hypothetical protein
MKRKLILGLFLLGFFLLANLALAEEKPSNGPVAVPSKCDCLKRNIALISPGLRADVLAKEPDRMPLYRYCHWDCMCYWGDCDCIWMCFDRKGIWIPTAR